MTREDIRHQARAFRQYHARLGTWNGPATFDRWARGKDLRWHDRERIRLEVRRQVRAREPLVPPLGGRGGRHGRP